MSNRTIISRICNAVKVLLGFGGIWAATSDDTGEQPVNKDTVDRINVIITNKDRNLFMIINSVNFP